MTTKIKSSNIFSLSSAELSALITDESGTGSIVFNGSPTFTGTPTAPTFSGALTGNATTATTLQTARLINGTSFNGSAAITTANWEQLEH